MKFISTTILLCISMLCKSQSSSVELKTGAGVLLNRYSSITEANAAIPLTITDAYIIELTSTYTAASEVYPIVFPLRSGSSSTNTITLRPAAGVTSSSIIASKSGGNIITLDDADYIRIDGRAGGVGTTQVLTIGNTATTSSSNSIAMINGATNNIITWCKITNATTTGTGRAVSFGVSVSNVTGNSDNTVSYCTIIGGRYMINSVGTAANPNTRILIKGCDISNFYFAGIWAQAGTGKLYIDSCRLYHTISVSGESLIYGILYDSQTDSTIISRNIFFDISQAGTGTVRAIGIRSSTGTNYALIYNNLINLTTSGTSQNMAGIELGSSSTTVTTRAGVYYNSVKIGGTLSTGGTSGNVVSAAFLRTGGTTGLAEIDIKNNIFVNERTGGTAGVQHVASGMTNNGGNLTLDYNTYNSSSGNLIRYGATVYNSFATYQSAVTAGNETNSNDVPVQFVSATDLHLGGTSVGNQNLKAIPISYIPTDFDDQIRGSVPYRGADEANVPLPVSLISFTGSREQNNVKLQWTTINENQLKGYEIQSSANGVDFVNISFVVTPSNSNAGTYSFTDVDAFTRNRTGVLFYRLGIVDKDGRRSLSPMVIVKSGEIKSLEISISPNPIVSGSIINLNSATDGKVSINVFNIYGQRLISEDQILVKGSNLVNLPALHFLPAGQYYMAAEMKNQRVVKDFIKR